MVSKGFLHTFTMDMHDLKHQKQDFVKFAQVGN